MGRRCTSPYILRYRGAGYNFDETMLLNFPRLLEKHELADDILAVINAYLGDRGLSLRQGTIWMPR